MVAHNVIFNALFMPFCGLSFSPPLCQPLHLNVSQQLYPPLLYVISDQSPPSLRRCILSPPPHTLLFLRHHSWLILSSWRLQATAQERVWGFPPPPLIFPSNTATSNGSTSFYPNSFSLEWRTRLVWWLHRCGSRDGLCAYYKKWF